MLAEIFSENPVPYPYFVGNVPPETMQADFDGRVDILPVSDPNIFSMAQRLSLAQTQLQLAQAAPQIHNVKKRIDVCMMRWILRILRLFYLRSLNLNQLIQRPRTEMLMKRHAITSISRARS